ncbi:MAG: DUF4038 domain-containing protein [Bacteroidota bacterium]
MPIFRPLLRFGAVLALLVVAACDTTGAPDPISGIPTGPFDPPIPVDPPVDPPPPDPDPSPDPGPPADPPAAGTAWIPPTPPAYPLATSGRTLVDADGVPVLLHGDAAWSAIANLTREEQERYLADRRRKGVNAIMTNLIEKAFTDNDPGWRNAYGEEPFASRIDDGYFMDFSVPNEAYWQRVDAFLDRAEAEGILVVAFPAYLGWQQGEDGWSSFLHVNGPDRLRAYGAFLGARYVDQPNLIWAAGGDWGPIGRYDLVDEVAALVEGIRSEDTVHLWTAHGGQQSAVEVYGDLDLDLNTTYRYPPTSVPEAVYLDYTRAPTTPFVFFEGWYENEWGVSVERLRFQAYAALLGGAGGQFYGNNPVWKFGDGWEAALDDPGALDMVHVGDLMRSRPFARRVPDDARETVPPGRGDRRDGSYLAAARTDDGSTVIAYAPTARPIDVAMDRVAGTEAQAWCFDPQTGRSTDLGRVPTSGRQTFEPCVDADWVLVLDDASLGLSPPGQP